MADVPINEGPRIKYSGTVTLGNISTIIGGLIVAASILWSISQYAGSLQHGIDTLTVRFDALECNLAARGAIDATTGPCTFRGSPGTR